jgi:hypothetical protein
VIDLQKLLRRLDDAGIEFVLVGGYAAMLHGSSLLTRDVDVCAMLTPTTVEKLRDAFREMHPVDRLSSPGNRSSMCPNRGLRSTTSISTPISARWIC